MKIASVLFLTLPLALTSCGKGVQITMDNNAPEFAEIFKGKNPVGVLEIEEANPTRRFSFGAQVGGPDLDANLYCAAFLTSVGTLVTSGECLKVSGRKDSDVKTMKLYLRNPGDTETSSHKIIAIVDSKTSKESNWSILVPKDGTKLAQEYGGIPIRDFSPSPQELKKPLKGKMVHLSKPKTDGTSLLSFIDVTLDTQQAVEEIRRNVRKQLSGETQAKTPPPPSRSDLENANDSENPRLGLDAEEPSISTTDQKVVEQRTEEQLPGVFSEGVQTVITTQFPPGMPGAPILMGKKALAIAFWENQFGIEAQNQRLAEKGEKSSIAIGPPIGQWIPAVKSPHQNPE